MNESTILVKLFTKKSKHFDESTNITIKKSQKLVEFHSFENVLKIGENSFTKKSEHFCASINISIKKSPKLVTF